MRAVGQRRTSQSVPRRAAAKGGTGARWPLRLRLNGKPVAARIRPHMTLLDFLRIDMGLTGTKGACLEGECGSCYVLLDGQPVNSCLMLAAQAQGRSVTTIEGLAPRGRLTRLQQAFVDHGAVQCGYCTPGLVIAAEAVRRRKRAPDSEEWVTGIEGNLCRCTGYTRILEALASTTRAGRAKK